MRRLGRERVCAGLCHLQRDLVKFGRVEADRARHCLAMGKAAVGLHQRIAETRGHFDMIAEHAVMADLQRGDAGTVTEFGLERGDRPPAACARIAQVIERCVIPRCDIAAVRGVDRRARDKRARQQVDQRAVTAQRGREFAE